MPRWICRFLNMRCDWLAENEKYSPDVVIQLRPTSPIRPVDMVDEAVGIAS